MLLLLCVLLVLGGPAWAEPIRRILVLYKASEKVNPKDFEVKWHLEPILLKQGFKLDYHNVDASLPPSEVMKRYSGLISWHRSAVYARPKEYVSWMRQQVVEGRKALILGNFGAYTADQKTWLSNEELNEFFLPFGLEFGAGFSGDAGQLQVVSQNGATAPNPLSYYMLFRSTNPDNQAWLTVRRKDLDKSDSSMVVVTPRGAMVGDTYLYQQQAGKIRWLVDRGKLLQQAFAPPSTQRLSSGGHLLALYKSSEKVDAASNYVARFLAPILKELGYSLDYHDICQGLPEPTKMAQYTGVISWYQTASMEQAANYCRWLTQQTLAGKKIVVLGNLGAFQELDSKSSPPTERWLLSHEYNTFLYPFGLEFKGMWTKDPQVLKVSQRDPDMIPYLEPQHLNHYYWIQSSNPENRAYLSLKRSDSKESESAVVVRTPFGGYALEGYLFKDLNGKGDYRWHVDMRRFLQDSLTYKAQQAPPSSSLRVVPSQPASVAPAATLPTAPPLPADCQEIPRRILAFYQRDHREQSESNRIHNNVETFLNHLGLVVEYRAIEDGLPTAQEMSGYRGIITWFQGASIPQAQAYADWLKTQIQAGRKVVILGDYGAYQDQSLSSQVDPGPTFKALGIDWRAASPVSGIRVNRTNLVTTNDAAIEYLDPAMCQSEHPIDLNEPDIKKGWPVYLSANPANKVYLKVKDREGAVCDAVTVTPQGGLVAGEFLLWVPPAQPIRSESRDPNQVGNGPAVADEVELPQLRIDAFRFFSEAFQTQDLPACDATTLNGSRIYFSHIDGDAMQGISLIDRASLNAEMLYREILQLCQLPVSVSFVTNNLEFKATPTYQRELRAARQILQLPWVEVACHTTHHPFNWRLGDLKQVEGDESGRLVRLPPDNGKEIVTSVDFTNQLVAPKGKKCRTLFWSGMCNPSEEALALCDGLGVSNLNGGDPVYDSRHPYLVGMTPLYSVVGGRYQFHTCAAGDFYYTSAWTKDYDGMKRLVEYFRTTEEPRRLRAMNLYYHFYLAERELGLQGLRIALDYIQAQRPACMFASNYIDIVKDMIVTKLGRDNQGRVVVCNSGALRTVRFDGQVQGPDLARCTGVLGYQRSGNRLYLHLDDSREHRIALGNPSGPQRVYLERASHYLEQWKGTSFVLRGTGPASFVLAGLDKNTPYRVSVAGQSDQVLRSDTTGRLTWEGLLDRYEGTYPVKISK